MRRSIGFIGAALVMAALVAWSIAISVFDPSRFGYFDPHGPAVLMSFVLPLLFTWRLRQAYRHYMRFDHALATAAVTQFMIFLLAFKAALDLDVIR